MGPSNNNCSVFLVLLATSSIMLDPPCAAAAFVFGASSGRNSFINSRTRTRESKSQVAAIKEMNVRQKNISGLTKLRFQASTNYATKPPPASQSRQINSDCCFLQEFIFREDSRDSILAGSQNRVELIAQPDQALYRLWQAETTKTSRRFAPPCPGDPILKVTSTGISFPGLTLLLVATVGCKQVLRKVDRDCKDIPELQITLLDNQLQAQGPKPLVWVFNQLTGADGKANNGSNQRRRQRQPQLNLIPRNSNANSQFSTHSTNAITAELCENGVIFRSAAEITIDVSFPSLLLNILPVSQAAAEKQGSDAILNVIKRDIGPSLESLQQKYDQIVADKRIEKTTATPK